MPNNYFGTTVSVSGLLTAHDMTETLKAASAGADGILIPESCLRAGDNIFLDDVTLEDFRSRFSSRIETVGNGRDLLEALAFWDSYQGVDGENASYMWQSNAAYTKKGGKA